MQPFQLFLVDPAEGDSAVDGGLSDMHPADLRLDCAAGRIARWQVPCSGALVDTPVRERLPRAL